ncbi:phosphoribosylformylglycinamidine cyclo-ligase [bacterium]|nr:phosphoribosylformylglycinamidine cyclo-ligase [bacterium]MCI0604728.1 phosphoribosylformylglycinamidine cyclo-ligase [bacterium]
MLDYKSAGVDAQKKEDSLSRLLEHVTRTFSLNLCRPLLPIGYFANVIDLRPLGYPLGIAFSTDGVGTKLLVAEAMDKYDTVGIDCVAMNVNDILCVGATPVSMVDYIAVSEANAKLLEQVARGLYAGCEMAGVNLSGGEIAQVAGLLAQKPGKISFDIVGTAIGTVDPDKIVIGQHLNDGDILIGLESNGLHSNGYTLARKICFEANHFSVHQYVEEFGKTLGEELLRPTRIYVKEILEMMKKAEIKGLFHITGDGLFNLIRTAAPVGYRIEKFPDPPPIFRFLQQAGRISNEEMFRVFNMGIGFAVVTSDDSAQYNRITEIAGRAGYAAHKLGYVIADPARTITIEPFGIVGRSGSFQHQ